MKRALLTSAVALVFLTLATDVVRADIVRFHYAPAACSGHTTLKVDPDGAAGRWRPWILSLRRSSWYCQPQATHIVTYVHPFTKRQVSVPIAFPEGTPRISFLSDAVIYTYTIYTIRVEFPRDGSVDVVYNSGLFRPPF